MSLNNTINEAADEVADTARKGWSLFRGLGFTAAVIVAYVAGIATTWIV